MNTLFKQKCKEFIYLLLNRKPKRDIRKFSNSAWYSSAFSTVSRPLGVIKKYQGGYNNWRNKHYDNLKDDIFLLLDNFSNCENLNEKIESISNKHNVYFGIVQKILNIMIKYIICNYWGDTGEFDSVIIKQKYPWVTDVEFVKQLAIPIDSIVLKSLKTIGVKTNISTKSGVKINGNPWSKMNRLDYEEIQFDIVSLASKANSFPLEYEMKTLWI